jgi:hypothetical protein
MDCFAEFEAMVPSVELVKDFYDMWAADYDTDMAVAEYNNPVDVAVELEKLFANRSPETSRFWTLELVPA